MNFRTPAVRLGLLPAGIALALTPAFASAQEAKGATDLDRIEVTGSRIRGANMETQQPILTMSRESLEKQGFTSVADVLQNMPSAGTPEISAADALSSGEDVGGYYVNIRNLGAQRTLVLLNGKRLGATTSGLQDLSQIPMSAIERIEVLKDGASSIYGSDAIAGVVNVITRKRFDGAEASVYFGQYDKGDGDTTEYSMTLGSEGERGGITLSAQYSKNDPVMAKDRVFSRDGNGGEYFPGSGWSPISQYGSYCDPRVLGDCNGRPEGEPQPIWNTLNPGGDPLNPADYSPLSAGQYANSNEQMTLKTGVERKSLYLNGNYDLTDTITFNADMLYNQRSTFQQLAGYPYQSASFGTPLSGDSIYSPTPGTDVEFRRRLWEVPRTTDSDLKTLRFAPTVSGYFEFAGRTFDWDVGALWNRNELTKRNRGDMSLIASRQALGPSHINADGVAQCGTAASPILLSNCRPWNPLLPYGVAGAGSLADPELQKLLFPTFVDTGETKTTSFTANLAGSIMTLPAGDLGFAFGIEHREEKGQFTPDAFAQSGESTGLGALSTAGSYDLDEVYLELNVPILSDVAFAKELTLNVASRYSDYSNFGDTINSKFGLTWRPTDELLVRGTWAEGFRAPTISDLYGGTSASFESYVDPCGAFATNSVAGNAGCTLAGVEPTYVQKAQGGDNCVNYPCQSPDRFFRTANAELQPETSTSKTVGLVWSPRFVEGLDISLDWYNYQIKNMIILDSPDRIMRDCYILGDSSRCNSHTRAADGHIDTMTYGITNLGAMETEGYDLGIKYRLPATAFGQFSFNWDTTYVSKYDEEGQNGAAQKIIIGQVGEEGIFRVRSNLGVNWSMGDFAANWTTRYHSGMKEGCVKDRPCTDPNRFANGEKDPIRSTGANTFHDLQVSWKAPWQATIALGANNVFDHRGATQFSQPNSSFSYYGGFDIGRFLYMKYTQRF